MQPNHCPTSKHSQTSDIGSKLYDAKETTSTTSEAYARDGELPRPEPQLWGLNHWSWGPAAYRESCRSCSYWGYYRPALSQPRGEEGAGGAGTVEATGRRTNSRSYKQEEEHWLVKEQEAGGGGTGPQ